MVTTWPGLRMSAELMAQARGFVDFQAQAVAGAVEEAVHAPVLSSGLVALGVEKLLDGAVDVDWRTAAARILAKPISWARQTVS